MKNVSLVVAIVVSAILIGCQDSSNVNPIGADAPHAASKVTVPNTNPDGIIELNTQVSLGPNEGIDNSYTLSGQIVYTLVQVDDQNFALSLVTDASLACLDEKGLSGKVYNESIDGVVVSPKEPASFEKVFAINGFDKEVDLHVQLFVTAESITVGNMWLEESARLDGTK